MPPSSLAPTRARARTHKHTQIQTHTELAAGPGGPVATIPEEDESDLADALSHSAIPGLQTHGCCQPAKTAADDQRAGFVSG